MNIITISLMSPLSEREREISFSLLTLRPYTRSVGLSSSNSIRASSATLLCSCPITHNPSYVLRLTTIDTISEPTLAESCPESLIVWSAGGAAVSVAGGRVMVIQVAAATICCAAAVPSAQGKQHIV